MRLSLGLGCLALAVVAGIDGMDVKDLHDMHDSLHDIDIGIGGHSYKHAFHQYTLDEYLQNVLHRPADEDQKTPEVKAHYTEWIEKKRAEHQQRLKDGTGSIWHTCAVALASHRRFTRKA